MEESKGEVHIPTYDDLDVYMRGDIYQLICPAEKLSYDSGLRPVGVSPVCPGADNYPDHFLQPKEE